MASTQSLLNQIDAAIEALLSGQHSSYSIGSRSVTRLDLNSLFDQRDRLRRQLDREQNGAFRLAKMQRPR
jgi:hypothetical protein